MWKKIRRTGSSQETFEHVVDQATEKRWDFVLARQILVLNYVIFFFLDCNSNIPVRDRKPKKILHEEHKVGGLFSASTKREPKRFASSKKLS